MNLKNCKYLAKIGFAVAGIAAALMAAGCSKKSESRTMPAPAAGTGQIDAANLQLITDTEEKERDDFSTNVRTLVRQGNFKLLESQASFYRAHKASFPDGTWKLAGFYGAFGDLPNETSEQGWQDLNQQLQEWDRENTNSITPLLALAQFYRGYAWHARGGDWGDKVTDEGSRLMGERLRQSLGCLQNARKLLPAEPDDEYYAIALRVCLGVGIDRTTYEKIFTEAVKNTPDNMAIYEQKAYYLLPRWYGQPGEWETFARAMSKRKDIPGSEEIFARCALHLRDLGIFYDEFSYSDDSWNDLKASFHALEQNYPDSLAIKSTFCLISGKLDDYQEGRAQMKLLGTNVDQSVWGSKDNFMGAVQWFGSDDASLED